MALMNKILDSWHDAFSVKRVFGDPIEKDGFTVIPVAMISGGGGGGRQTEAEGAEGGDEGEGGGFGGMARPAGAYVITADSVQWHPALDITLLGIGGLVLAALITLVLGKALGRRR